jgi:hypothetical protein
VKLLKALRLDASDGFVFERAAAGGEWAVPGSFLFWDADPAALDGKARAAFRAGFLGIESFGWSTLATVVEASEDEREAAIEGLAMQLVARCGAPDLAAALPAAREEIAFAESLAQHPPRTVIALHRSVEDGEIRERFRTLQPGQPTQAPAFSFVTVDEEDAPAEHVDLKALAGAKP